jgi:hypothetical protein
MQTHLEPQEIYDRREGERRNGRKNIEKRLGARKIVQNLEWLSSVVIYWAGVVQKSKRMDNIAYRPVTAIIGERLAMLGLRPGIYSIDIVYPADSPSPKNFRTTPSAAINPTMLNPISVDDSLIAKASQAIVASNRYPKALPKILGDVAGWKSKSEKRIRLLGKAIRCAREVIRNDPDSLILEEACLWIGEDKMRPSQRLSTSEVQDWLGKQPKNRPGTRLAAIVLGQRKVSYHLTGGYEKWLNLGSTFSRWSPDVLYRIFEKEDGHARIEKLKPSLSGINSKHAELALLEFYLADPSKDPCTLLEMLPHIFGALDRTHHELERRWGLFNDLMKRAFELAAAFAGSQATTHMRWEELRLPDLAFVRILKEEPKAKRVHWGEATFVPGQSFWYSVNQTAKLYFGGEILDKEALWQIHFSGGKDFKELIRLQSRMGFKKSFSLPAKEWVLTVSGLSGRIAAFGGGPEVLTLIASWLDECRMVCCPGRKGEGALRLALGGIEKGIAFSMCENRNLINFLEILGLHGRELLRSAVSSLESARPQDGDSNLPYEKRLLRRLAVPFQVISNLGLLDREQCMKIIDLDLFLPVGELLEANPKSLRDFIDWITKLGGNEWSSSELNDWVRVFSIKNRRLQKSLIGWAEKVIQGHNFRRDDIASFAESIVCQADEMNNRGKKRGVELDGYISCNLWICDRILSALQRTDEEIANACGVRNLFSYRSKILQICCVWEERGYGRTELLVDRLLRWCALLDKGDRARPHIELSYPSLGLPVDLSAGSCERLVRILSSQVVERLRLISWEGQPEGWAFLHQKEEIRQFLCGCVDRPELIDRVLSILKRIAVAARLQGKKVLLAEMRRWVSSQEQRASGTFDDSARTGEALLKLYTAYRSLQGGSTIPPKSVRKTIRLRETIFKEHEHLCREERLGTLDNSGRLRLVKIRRLLAEPRLVDKWIESSLSANLGKQIQLVKIEVLEDIVEKAIQSCWLKVIGERGLKSNSPDWDNALLLYLTTKKNRRQLRHLLIAETEGDHQWRQRHPANLAFARRIKEKGIDFDAWLGPNEISLNVGGEIWRGYAELDPIRILQMGNLFGTCLRVEGFNNFATIANAVEVNKRVLYIRKPNGAVVGRKLIALTRNGLLLGFESYGTGSLDVGVGGGSPWVKVIFDLLCLEIIDRTGAGFPTPEEEEALGKNRLLDKELKLFAEGYYEWVEPFDWWVRELSAVSVDKRSAKVPALKESLIRSIHGGDEMKELPTIGDGATIRLLIWLGDEALHVIEGILESSILSSRQLRVILRHSQSNIVREKVHRWLAEKPTE